MGILVKLETNDIPTWGIIELQGDLKSRNNEEFLSKFVGDLHFSTLSNEVPTLIIGHHLLHGKIVDMEKPFAVLEQKVVENGSAEMKVPTVEYIVKAIVKKKILFKIRPKPIIVSSE